MKESYVAQISRHGLIDRSHVAAAPTKASADWLFTPFVGATFGGSADIGGLGEDFEDEFERKLNYGASLAWMGAGAVGFEVDFGYSPNFFEVSPDDDDFDLTATATSRR